MGITPFAQRFIDLCKQANTNPSALATKVNVAHSTFTRIANGDRNPSVDTLTVIATALGLSLEQLVHGTDAEERVAEAQRLIPRSTLDDAVKQIAEYEHKARDQNRQLWQKEDDLEAERKKRREAEDERNKAVSAHKAIEQAFEGAKERVMAAEKLAKEARDDAIHYRNAFEKAYANVLALESALKDLKESTKEAAFVGKVNTVLSAFTAAFSFGTYMNTTEEKSKARRKPKQNPGRSRRTTTKKRKS